MQQLSKAVLVMIVLAIAGGPAQSRSLQVAGSAGYLSEWEFTGAVTETNSAGRRDYSGTLIWKHVGLCSVNGPQERQGAIRFQLSSPGHRSSSLHHIDATISLDDARCIYSGDLSSSSSGNMDCSDAKGVPLSISISDTP
jgi:hypothetical protein